MAGTPYYLAPEVLVGQYNKECDCWSLGVIMYIILSGYLPFPGRTQGEVYDKVKNGLYDFNHDSFKNVTESAKDLISKLLTVDKKKRFACAQAL